MRVSATSADFDTFSTAVGLALISGGLSLVATYLVGLTVALVALAGAGWAAGHVGSRGAYPGPSLDRGRKVALACLATGIVAFFLLPPPLVDGRALAIAVSFLPLWWVERSSHARRVRPLDGVS
ncbi:MAG: hypothetical protein WB947_04290 [Thermoplasmata archaeon]